MKMEKMIGIWGALMIMILVSACAGTGGLGGAGTVRTYSQDYAFMAEAVERVIKGNGLNIDQVSEAKNPKQMTLVISRSKYVNNQSVRQNQGEVIVQAVNENETTVRVENPEYHFSVPDRKKENYQRMIFPRLEKYLKDKGVNENK